jgi:hypothetical protein
LFQDQPTKSRIAAIREEIQSLNGAGASMKSIADTEGAKVADARKEHFERFKNGEDVASRFWIAISTLLTGLYFGKDFIHSRNR